MYKMLLKSPLTLSGPLSGYSVSMNNNFVALIYMSQPERRGDLPTGEKVSLQESILNFRQLDWQKILSPGFIYELSSPINWRIKD